MAIEQEAQRAATEHIPSIGSRPQRGDFVLTNSPFLYWEGEDINISQLVRNLQTGLRNRYATNSSTIGLIRAVKEVLTKPQEPQK